MSCQRGSSHGSGGVVSRDAKGTESLMGWKEGKTLDKGSGR